MQAYESRITVVLVHHRYPEHTATCLEALTHQTTAHRVLVVENPFPGETIFEVAKQFPNVGVLPLKRNVGFARAVNLAARRLQHSTEILVTLNPDTVPNPDFLEHLVEPFSNPTIASVAGTLVFASNPAMIASAGINIFRNGLALDARLGQPVEPIPQPQPVFGASGGAAAYRLSAFLDAGGYCDAFFLYLEDVDLAWRLRLLGGSCIWAPSAVATHVYSAAAGEGSRLKRRLLSRNRIWTLARCLPEHLWRLHRAEILKFDARAVAWAGMHGDIALLAGRAEALAHLPARLCERRAIQRSVTILPDELDRWIEVPPADSELLRLRRLTARLAGGNPALR